MYRTFTNPAAATFAWVGAQNCEVVFLNDFRWSEKVIPWHDLLFLVKYFICLRLSPTLHTTSNLLKTLQYSVLEKSNMFVAVFLMNANRNEACAMEHIQL